jgi:hypothetical protein
MITYDEIFNSDWDDSSFPVSFQIFLFSGYNKAYESSSSYVRHNHLRVQFKSMCALSGFNFNNAGSLQELIITRGKEVSEVTSFSHVASKYLIF